MWKNIILITIVLAIVAGVVPVTGNDGANVEKFILLETKDEQACGEEVQKLVNDFSTNIMKDLKSLIPTTKDDDDDETSLLDMESKGPGGVRSMFMNSIRDIGEDEDEDEEEKEEAKEEVKKEVEKQQEAEKKDNEVVEVTTTAPKAAEDAKNKTIQLQEKEKNEVKKEEKEEENKLNKFLNKTIVEIKFPKETSAKLIAETRQAFKDAEKANEKAEKLISGMKDVAPESKGNLQNALDLVKNVLRRLIKDCNQYEYIEGKYCKISINEHSLREGVADLKKDILKCKENPNDECIIKNPFPNPELEVTDENNFHSEFIEVVMQMNQRAMVSEEEKLILQSSLSGKSRAELVDAALENPEIKKSLAKKKIAPTMFNKLDSKDVGAIEHLFNTTNDTHKIETAIDQFERKYEKEQKNGTENTADINAEDKREDFDEKLAEMKCNLGTDYTAIQCQESERQVNLLSCFPKPSKYNVSKDENNTYSWTVTNLTSGICGRPKYFDVKSGMNGARVYLDALISSRDKRNQIINAIGKGLELKVIKDTCNNSGDEVATVSISEKDRQAEVFVKIKCKDDSCSKYICDGDDGEEKPVSEILLAYKLPGKCTKWVVFGRARVVGTSITVHRQCVVFKAYQGTKNRRRLLSTVGGSRTSGSAC
jgi:hypothetical protein